MRACAWVLLLLAQTAGGDPLGSLRRSASQTRVECSGALETVMLLAQLASSGPAASEFQAQARAHFAAHTRHPAVRETAELMERGLGPAELARLSTFMAAAPHFMLSDSAELAELAAVLPGGDVPFNIDRLHGYAKLVREFYWDRHVGRFLRAATPGYQQALRRPLPAGLPAADKVLISLLAPAGPAEFPRRTPRPMTYLLLGL